MKQSDIFTIVIVAIVGVVVSSFLLNMILGDPSGKSVTFKTVDVVEATLAEPDPEVFNPEAINPTVEVYVGDCIDRDQNGVLDEAERMACGRVESAKNDANNTQSNNAVNTGDDVETEEETEQPEENVEENEEDEETEEPMVNPDEAEEE